MIQKVAYGVLQRQLQAHHVYFTKDGRPRHESSDLLTVPMDDGVIEPYAAFLRGNILCAMGSFTYSKSTVSPDMRIGRYGSIASGLTVLGFRHPYEWASTSAFAYDGNFPMFDHAARACEQERPVLKVRGPVRPRRIEIGHDVWIGDNVQLRKGLSIGHGAVIAARSVVTRDIPPYAIVGGNPATIIKFRFPDATIERLLGSAWWDFHFSDFVGAPVDNPDAFAHWIGDRSATGQLAPFRPQAIRLRDLTTGTPSSSHASSAN